MTERDLVTLLNQLQTERATKNDWQDLHETIEAYAQRCLGRAIARHPRRAEIVATIKQLAEVD